MVYAMKNDDEESGKVVDEHGWMEGGEESCGVDSIYEMKKMISNKSSRHNFSYTVWKTTLATIIKGQ
jgi:hypothetical protein